MPAKLDDKKSARSLNKPEEIAAALAESYIQINQGIKTLNDPLLPFNIYIAKKRVEFLGMTFDADHKFNLLSAINLCAIHELSLPKWVKEEYIKAFNDIDNLNVKKLEEVFGSKLPKGAHLSAQKKKNDNLLAVYIEVGKAHIEGKSIDMELFDEVGKKFNIGKTLASEYYYEFYSMFGTPQPGFNDPMPDQFLPEIFK